MTSPPSSSTKPSNRLLSHCTSQSPDLRGLKRSVSSGVKSIADEHKYGGTLIRRGARVQLEDVYCSVLDGSGTCEHAATIFPCPFWLNDPLSHTTCSTISLRDLQSLKQHLYRRHWETEYNCTQCFATFTSHSILMAHLRDGHCKKIDTSPFPGLIKFDKMRYLEQERYGYFEQQWNDVYQILFPGQEPPESPYLGDQCDQSTVGHFVTLFKACPDILHHLQPSVESPNTAMVSPIPLETLRILHQAMDQIGRLPDPIAIKLLAPSEQSEQPTMKQSANKLAAQAAFGDQNHGMEIVTTNNDIPIVTAYGADHGDHHSLHTNEGSWHHTAYDASDERQADGQLCQTTPGLQRNVAAYSPVDVPQNGRPPLASNAVSEEISRDITRRERPVRGAACCVRCGVQENSYELETSEEASQADWAVAALIDGDEASTESAEGASTSSGSLACNSSERLGGGITNMQGSLKRKRDGQMSDDGSGRMKADSKAKSRGWSTGKEGKIFACPEWVAKPFDSEATGSETIGNRVCSTVIIKSISYLREHLKRVHKTYICAKCFTLVRDCINVPALENHGCCGRHDNESQSGEHDTRTWQRIFTLLNPGRRVPKSPYRIDHLDLIPVLYTTDLFRFLGPALRHMMSERISAHLGSLVSRTRPTMLRALKLALYPQHYHEYYEAYGEPGFADDEEFLLQTGFQPVPLQPQGWQAQSDSGHDSSSVHIHPGHQLGRLSMSATPFSQASCTPSSST